MRNAAKFVWVGEKAHVLGTAQARGGRRRLGVNEGLLALKRGRLQSGAHLRLRRDLLLVQLLGLLLLQRLACFEEGCQWAWKSERFKRDCECAMHN